MQIARSQEGDCMGQQVHGELLILLRDEEMHRRRLTHSFHLTDWQMPNVAKWDCVAEGLVRKACAYHVGGSMNPYRLRRTIIHVLNIEMSWDTCFAPATVHPSLCPSETYRVCEDVRVCMPASSYLCCRNSLKRYKAASHKSYS